MLKLCSDTPISWVGRAEAHLDQLLIDHAHCEKKAAGTAVSLLFALNDDVDLGRQLSEIAREELEHFEAVLSLLERRNIPFRNQRPSSYGGKLKQLARSTQIERRVDLLLIAAIIEARSCERFALLRDHLQDRELAAFYGDLFASEARHYRTYIDFARRFAPDDAVYARHEQLCGAEADIIATPDGLVRMHS